MMTRQIGLVLSLVMLIGAFALPVQGTVAQTAAERLPDTFVGTWVGTAEQVSPTQSSEYPVEIELTGGEQFAPVGTIDYTGSNWSCGGALVLWLVVDETTVATGENITTGQDVCSSGGFVRLTLNDNDTLSFEWRRPDMADVVTATLTPAA